MATNTDEDDWTPITDDVSVSPRELVVKGEQYTLSDKPRLKREPSNGVWTVPMLIGAALMMFFSFLVAQEPYPHAAIGIWGLTVLHVGLFALMFMTIGTIVSVFGHQSVYVKTSDGRKVCVLDDVSFEAVSGYEKQLRSAMGLVSS